MIDSKARYGKGHSLSLSGSTLVGISRELSTSRHKYICFSGFVFFLFIQDSKMVVGLLRVIVAACSLGRRGAHCRGVRADGGDGIQGPQARVLEV